MALMPIAGTGSTAAQGEEESDLARLLRIGTVLSIPLVMLAMSPM